MDRRKFLIATAAYAAVPLAPTVADAPVMTPVASPGLHVQQFGRGLRAKIYPHQQAVLDLFKDGKINFSTDTRVFGVQDRRVFNVR